MQLLCLLVSEPATSQKTLTPAVGEIRSHLEPVSLHKEYIHRISFYPKTKFEFNMNMGRREGWIVIQCHMVTSSPPILAELCFFTCKAWVQISVLGVGKNKDKVVPDEKPRKDSLKYRQGLRKVVSEHQSSSIF